MVVILGLAVLLTAVVIGFAGVLANSGPDHPLPEHVNVLGYHITGSTSTLFLVGIMVGAIAMLGLSLLLTGTRRTSARERAARRELDSSRRETAFLNLERDQRLAHDQKATDASSSGPVTTRTKKTVFDRWTASRRPKDTVPRSPVINNGKQGVHNELR